MPVAAVRQNANQGEREDLALRAGQTNPGNTVNYATPEEQAYYAATKPKKKSSLGMMLNLAATLAGSAIGFPVLGAALGGGANGVANGGGLKGALLGAGLGGLGAYGGGALGQALSGLGGAAGAGLGGAAGAAGGAAGSGAGSALGGLAGDLLGGTVAPVTVTALTQGLGSTLGGLAGSLGGGALGPALAGGNSGSGTSGGDTGTDWGEFGNMGPTTDADWARFAQGGFGGLPINGEYPFGTPTGGGPITDLEPVDVIGSTPSGGNPLTGVLPLINGNVDLTTIGQPEITPPGEEGLDQNDLMDAIQQLLGGQQPTMLGGMIGGQLPGTPIGRPGGGGGPPTGSNGGGGDVPTGRGVVSNRPALAPPAAPMLKGAQAGGQSGVGVGSAGSLDLNGSLAPDIYPWTTGGL